MDSRTAHVPIYDNAAVEHQLRADRDEMLAPGRPRCLDNVLSCLTDLLL